MRSVCYQQSGGESAVGKVEQQREQREYEKSLLVPVLSSTQKKQRAIKEVEPMDNNEDDGQSSCQISIVTDALSKPVVHQNQLVLLRQLLPLNLAHYSATWLQQRISECKKLCW